MKSILHVSCSPNGPAAESYRLSSKIVNHLMQRASSADVIERDVGNGSISHIDSSYAQLQHAASPELSNFGSAARSELLIQELERADIVVIGTPVHNLGAPSALKSWIDHIVRAGRTFDISAAGKRPLLKDRPVYIAIASGGVFSGERARQPDFLTPYLRVILSQIGLLNLTFFAVQGTAHSAESLRQARDTTNAELDVHFSR